MGIINLCVAAVTRHLGLALTLGLPVHVHTFMDGSKALVVYIGRRENGERNMLIIHRLVPGTDVEETERGKRLKRATLITPNGKQPFWGQLERAPETAYVALLAPRESITFQNEGDTQCVATQGVTDTLDIYLIQIRQGPVGAVTFTIRGDDQITSSDDGRRSSRTYKLAFLDGELCVEEVS